MNYIKRLESENANLKAKVICTLAEIQNMREHLALSKFQGIDSDGNPRDWIRTWEVEHFCQRLIDGLDTDF